MRPKKRTLLFGDKVEIKADSYVFIEKIREFFLEKMIFIPHFLLKNEEKMGCFYQKNKNFFKKMEVGETTMAKRLEQNLEIPVGRKLKVMGLTKICNSVNILP